MKSFIRELLIKYHSNRIVTAPTSTLKRYHMQMMVKHIKAREQSQIKRMERKRGLV